LNGLALCAGVGGLELGIERVFDGYQTVAFVEGEAFAASNLVKKMEEGSLAAAPIWSDLRTFDGIPWRGKVDVLSAGFPCQPFSIAGKREGVEDSRHLWPSVSRIIGEVRPSIIVLENVPGVIDAAGLGIAGNLSQMGYDFAWGIVRASEAGAPHRRARFFGVGILADSDGDSCGTREPQRTFRELPSTGGGLPNGQNKGETGKISRGSGEISDANGESESNEPFHARQRRIIQEPLSNAGREPGEVPIKWELSAIKVASSVGRWREIDSSNWFKIEPGVGRVVDGVADWVDRMRACGNGVVPHQAELAIRILLNTLIERRIQA
jgi:DNA (cytosine-5)-methyltransferase 1